MKSIILFFVMSPFLVVGSINTETALLRSDLISDNEEIVYVDFSNNINLLNNGLNAYISFQNDSETFLLTHVEDCVYQSSLPFDRLRDEETFFRIGFYSSAIISSWINLKNDYNYVYLGDCINNQFIEITGLGYYKLNIKKENNATYSSQRIWLKQGDSSYSFEDNRKLAIKYEQFNEKYLVLMNSVDNAYDSSLYYFADIPAFLTEFSFFVVSIKSNNSCLCYQNYKVNQLIYGACHSFDLANGFSIKQVFVSGANAFLLSLVVEAYLTYGEGDANGSTYKTVKTLFQTWFSNKSATKSDLKKTIIKDYSGFLENGGTYEGLEKDTNYSVNEKWNAMCLNAGVDPNSGELLKDKPLFKISGKAIVIVILCASLIISITLIIVLKEKKKNSN